MLSHLLPASTRCGMVYVDPNELKWSPYVRTWLQKLPEGMKEETKKYLWGLFASYLDEGFKFVRKNCTQGIDQVCALATAPALYTCYIRSSTFGYKLLYIHIMYVYTLRMDMAYVLYV